MRGISYKPPSMQGYCTIDNTGAKHEHCRCSNVDEDANNCREMCDIDAKCKGYSYRTSNSKCHLYTTSMCTKGCNKRKRGKLGDIREKYHADESGCFIKVKGKILYFKVRK